MKTRDWLALVVLACVAGDRVGYARRERELEDEPLPAMLPIFSPPELPLTADERAAIEREAQRQGR